MFKIIVILLSFIVSSMAACPSMIDGVSYGNLPKLTDSGPAQFGGDWTAMGGSDGYWYNWNICEAQRNCPSCSQPETVVCQDCLGMPKSLGVLSTQSISILPGINSVNFVYTNGDYSNGCAAHRQSNISVACSKSATQVIAISSIYCNWTILMSSSNACPALVAPLSPTQVPALKDMQSVWGNTMGWQGDVSTSACSWRGIQCIEANNYSYVSSISLARQQLQGSIPSSIGDLTTCGGIDLSGNPLGGSIPDSLFTINSLSYLDLSYCNLNGTLPSSFANSKLLDMLYLQGNYLTGLVSDFVCILSAYDLQRNDWQCPLPSCCNEQGNSLCIPCFQ